jgi:hypothetical protein
LGVDPIFERRVEQMAKLTEEQLRELIAKSAPGAEIVDAHRPPKAPPSSAISVPNRADLSTKIAKRQAAMDGAAIDTGAEPDPLDDDQSEIVSFRTEGPEGAPRSQTVLLSKDGDVIAEQG